MRSSTIACNRCGEPVEDGRRVNGSKTCRYCASQSGVHKKNRRTPRWQELPQLRKRRSK